MEIVDINDRDKLFSLYDSSEVNRYFEKKNKLKEFANKYGEPYSIKIETYRDCDYYDWLTTVYYSLEKEIPPNSYRHKNITLYLYKYGRQNYGDENLCTISVKGKDGTFFYIYFDYTKNGKIDYVCIIDDILNLKHIEFYGKHRLDECFYEDGEFKIFKRL